MAAGAICSRVVLSTVLVRCILLSVIIPQRAVSYYLPGIAPNEYIQGAPIEILATKLTSSREKLPYPYYSVPLCRPASDEIPKSYPVNLGQILAGERAYPTPFKIHMQLPQACTYMCSVQLDKIDTKSFKNLRRRIVQGYSVRLSADNLPVVSHRESGKRLSRATRFGYKLGDVDDGVVYINNHLDFTVHINTPSMSPKSIGAAVGLLREEDASTDEFRVVGFEVAPRSIGHGRKASSLSCKGDLAPQPVARHENISFTYSVTFRLSGQEWATRWNPLIERNANLKKIRWNSIANSLLLILILGGLVAIVITRSLSRDIARFQELEASSLEDSTSWKVLQGDVFRTPSNPVVLAVVVGSGSQILAMAVVTKILTLFGVLSPAKRGALLSALIISYILSSLVSGYSSARAYLSMDGKYPRKFVTVGSAFLVPLSCFSIFFALNLAVSFTGSSSAVPFTTLLLLFFAWFGVSIPLVLLGSFIGFHQKYDAVPFRTSPTTHAIPKSAQNLSRVMYNVGGIVPFACIFVELVYILDDLNNEHIFYLYGALGTLFLILVVSLAETSVIFTYTGLCKGNWKWAWQSFGAAASTGVYVFAYAVYYLFRVPDGAPEGAAFVAWLVYVTYMIVACGAFGLMCGSIGFYSSQWFVHTIYQRLRAD